MASQFLQMQMDYIFFFYGLGFILLAAATRALSRAGEQQVHWKWLCLFGLMHGINEWLDMLVIAMKDDPAFSVVRLVILILSFLFLIEFGRSGTKAVKEKGPGRWVFVLLLSMAGFGAFAGMPGLNAAARYVLGLTGGLWAAVTLWRQRSAAQPGNRFLSIAALSLGFYGLATGVVVPQAAFFPANFLNQSSFAAFAGFPIQLLRGVLACTAAAAVWQYYGAWRRSAIREVITSAAVRRERWVIAAVAAVLTAGWIMTGSFGEFGRQLDEERYTSELELARSAFEGSVQTANDLVKTLAASPSLVARGRRGRSDLDTINATLDRYSRIIPDSICYLLDSRGVTLASSNRDTPEGFVGHSYAVRPYFKEAMEGRQGRYVAVGLTSKSPGYYSSYPVRNAGGGIVGAAVVKLNIDKPLMAPIRGGYGFLVDPNGVILASTQPGLFLKTLRPIGEGMRRQLAKTKQYPDLPDSPVLPADSAVGTLFAFQGVYLQRFDLKTSVEGLSFVLLGSMDSWKMARLVAILITLLVAVLLIAFFITQQRDSESSARIAASEKLYRTLVEGSPNWVALFDHDGRCIALNGNGLASMGRTEAEVLGKRLPEIWSQDAGAMLEDSLSRVLRGERVSFEADQFLPDGTSLTLHTVLNPVCEQDGTVSSFVAIANDISARKQAERERIQMERRLQQAEKAGSLGRMAGAIAHHFNNQLGVVIGNLELAIEGLPQGAEPALERNVARAMKAADRAVEMSSLMLTYLGQSLDRHEHLDLSEACRRSLPMLQAVVTGDVELKTDLPAPGPIVNANANEITQILVNLVTNAWEAVGAGRGAIRLSVKTVFAVNLPAGRRFPVEWQPQDRAYACLKVTDTGGGIKDKDIESLFDPFFTSKFTGRGMGLSVVLGIVRAHDGVITVESEPDRGSTFRVFFPVLRQENPGRQDPAEK